ncbi:ASCH domain-containing protein [Halobacillus sp. K22]|uniref:ASCH domain-containing protein n=1 Tax=Halobacillus sp. K22 TaxID=3457431 RepID=UPI003FCDFD08
MYEWENKALPPKGLPNIILNGDGEAVAIMETIAVKVVPFDVVAEEHAFLEGEGDRTLRYWRDVHETFFRKNWKR